MAWGWNDKPNYFYDIAWLILEGDKHLQKQKVGHDDPADLSIPSFFEK